MINLANGDKCTGCCACMNSCEVDALQIKTDEFGFFRPAIDQNKCIRCHRCEKICPILHVQEYFEKNNSAFLDKSICWAAWAEDNTRDISSSGGIFTVLAEAILHSGGVVYGVSQHANSPFDFGFKRVENINMLHELRGSKYVQSYAGDVYRQVKEDLRLNRKVLFTGTPCQVAGLRNFLGENNPNLLAVDIVCHGVPSQKMFKQYMKENFSEAKNIYFRDKDFGWSCTNLLVELSGKRKHTILYDKSAYEKAFHNSTDLQMACYDCPFSGLNRTGDLTLGDFWGIDTFKSDWNDGRGTSLVLINTIHGRKFFQHIQPNLKRTEQVPITYAMGNRLHETIAIPKNRDRFFNLWKKYSFTKAADIATSNHFDIGLVGDWAVENYGANITYYALYSVLHDELKFDVLLIERPLNSSWPPKMPPSLFRKLPYRDYEWAPYIKTKSELAALNGNCDAFVVGSDQIWNNSLFHAFGDWADLSWVHSDHLKISYATSFGADYIWGSKEDQAKMKFFLNQFDAISVREKSGVDILKREYEVEGTQVLDPVFLCSKDKYTRLAEAEIKIAINNKPFVFSYTLDIDENKVAVLKKASEFLDCSLIIATDAAKANVREVPIYGNIIMQNLCMEEWLANIQSCDYMITDSFHGMCFAIIFHKPFIAIVNEGRGATRFYSLLTLLGLENHLAEDAISAYDKIYLLKEHINWEKIDDILNDEKIKSLNWLKKSLRISRENKIINTYDLLSADVIKHNEHINYIPGYSYIDVIPVQSNSGKRTRLALGDQFIEFQVFDNNKAERISRFAFVEDLDELAQITLKRQNDLLQQLQKNINDTIDLRKQIIDIQKKNEILNSQLLYMAEANNSLIHSLSFRLGRLITWLPRKIRNILKK